VILSVIFDAWPFRSAGGRFPQVVARCCGLQRTRGGSCRQRLFEACGDILPAELEAVYYRQNVGLAEAG